MASIYYIRNKITGKWVSTTHGFETDDYADTSCRYWSEKKARKMVNELKAADARRKEFYPIGATSIYPSNPEYEVVAFRLVEVGVV